MENFAVLRDVEHDPEFLHGYLYKIALGQMRRSSRERERLRPHTFPAWQRKKLLAILEMLGEFPERTHLEPTVSGVISRKGYIVEKLVYQTYPGLYCTALLYIPKKAVFPVPGFIFPCGHVEPAKAAVPYQTACIGLVKKGCVVLCYDPVGQGERKLYWDRRRERSKVGDGPAEHTVAGHQCYLMGMNLAMWRIWDGIRAIDYLMARPEVDKCRIGCAGNSGGGTLTTYICALDPRVRLSFPGCYITTMQANFEDRIGADPEQHLIPQIARGVEHVDYLGLVCPRHLRIGAARRDFFPIRGALRTYRGLKRLYAMMGVPERVSMVVSPLEHGLTKPLREGLYRWANSVFGLRRSGGEPRIRVEREKTLLCTPTGQVSTSFKDAETIHTLNLKILPKIIFERRIVEGAAAQRMESARLRRLARETIRMYDPPGALRARSLGESAGEGLSIEKILIEPERGILLPAILLRSAHPSKAPAVIYVHHDGKAAALPRARRLARSGRTVLAVDLRGIGETASRGGHWGRETKHKHPGSELAHMALMIDRPLLAQWVVDMERCAEYLDGRRGVAGGCVLLAEGFLGIAALHAAALSKRIRAALLVAPLLSFRSAAEIEIHSYPVAAYAYGILRRYDLAEMAAASAPKPLVLIDPVGADGRGASLREARREYRVAASAYRNLGADGAFKILSGGSGEREIIKMTGGKRG